MKMHEKIIGIIAFVSLVLGGLLFLGGQPPVYPPTDASYEWGTVELIENNRWHPNAGYAILNITPIKDINITDESHMRTWFRKRLPNGSIVETTELTYTFQILTEEKYNKTTTVYGTKAVMVSKIDNKTNESKLVEVQERYVISSKTTEKSRDAWEEYKYVGDILKAGNSYLIRVDMRNMQWNVDYDWVFAESFSGIEKSYEQWAWMNSSWLKRKKLILNETVNLSRVEEPVYFRLDNDSDINSSSLANYSDIRISYGETTEWTSGIFNYTEGGVEYWYVGWNANASALTEEEYYIYFNNSAAPTTSYTDLVVVTGAGDWTIDGKGTHGYDDAILDVDGGTVKSFKLDDTTQILDETFPRMPGLRSDTAIVIFSEGEVDDTCTEIADTSAVAIYLCEAGEDSDGDGIAETGETYVYFYFWANTIETFTTFGINEEGEIVGNMIDEGVTNGIYYDNSFTSGDIFVTATNGYYVNNMTTTEELYTIWDEDFDNCDGIRLVHEATKDRTYLCTRSGDEYNLTAEVGAIPPFWFQVDGACTDGWNTCGQNWEKKYDNKLRDNIIVGAEEGTNEITNISPGNTTVICTENHIYFNVTATGMDTANLTFNNL